ncbi:MAG: hypothetical protein RSA84_07950 [Acinetobacter sp.]
MKEILSGQLDAISGGWQDRDGSGKRSASNNGSGNSRGGSNGGRGVQSFASKYSPYGSGAGARGFWGGGDSMGTDNGGRSRSSGSADRRR